MDAEPGDNIVTIAALGLLAYASADIGHHALGHAAACLGLGGRVLSLSSIFVNCSLRGAQIDLAGPCANLVIGLAPMLIVRRSTRASSATRLFWILVAAFNPHGGAAVLRHALPQSLLLSIGLLFLPARAASVPFSGRQQAAIAFSISRAIAAAIVGAASIVFLGPGVSIAI